MNKLIACLALVASVSLAADYTPVTREAGGGQNAYGQITVTASSQTVTNGEIIVVGAYPVIVVNHTGAETTSTNSLAAAAASRVGATFTVVNASTNGLIIADTAPVYNSGATLGTRDTATYFVKATNEIIQVSTSNN